MNDNFDNLTPLSESETPEPPPPPPQRKSLFVIFLAWAIILFLVVRVVTVHEEPQAEDWQLQKNISLMLHRVVGHMFVVQTQVAKDPDRAKFVEQAEEMLDKFETGPVADRIRLIILRGETAGPEAALIALDDLRNRMAINEVEVSEDEVTTLDLLTKLYEGAVNQEEGEAREPILTPVESEWLHDKLGWFGDLALTIDNKTDPALKKEVVRPAQRTMAVFIGAMALVFLLGVVGLIGLGVFLIGGLVGGVKSRVQTGNGGGVYAETFAVWMGIFLGLTWLAQRYAPLESRFLMIALAFFGSLIALTWPVLRGVPWQQVREDIGWTAGPGGIYEPAMGVACYAMTLPLLIPAVIVVLFLQQTGVADLGVPQVDIHPVDNFDPQGFPAHPIVGYLSGTNWWVKIQLLLVAGVAAPIVEETMFRGVLYRHLREGSRWLGTLLSVVFSGTVVSFVFAIIHPQGLIAVPVLMALAYGFTIYREWRGSVVAPIVAHGLHNSLILLIGIAIFSA